ncbi:MAG: hypothetical protein FWD06_08555 [Oscillospiraceae bacterium]|nr:hypothetical protein [Oscillospiraceae bacterium]
MKTPSKSTKLILYAIYSVFTAVLYGYAMFGVFVRLTRATDSFSMLHAYLLNLFVIVVMLIADNRINDYLLTKYEPRRRSGFFTRFLYWESLVSFKTTLYLFYIFILVISRVLTLEPRLMFNEAFYGFVISIEYGLILVVVFDKFIDYLTKDIKRIKKIAEKLRGTFNTKGE